MQQFSVGAQPLEWPDSYKYLGVTSEEYMPHDLGIGILAGCAARAWGPLISKSQKEAKSQNPE